MLTVIAERSEATNLDDGSPMLSSRWYVYIYIYVRTSASIRFIKERNKVSTASSYCLEQWRARLIVDGISVKTDNTVKESRGRARVKES